MNQRATGLLDGLRFLTAHLESGLCKGLGHVEGSPSLCGGEEDVGERQCRRHGLQASSAVLGKVSASDAPCSRSRGSVFRLLGGEQVPVGLSAFCSCSSWVPESPPEGRAQKLVSGTWWALQQGWTESFGICRL